jgi:hypothetical protein
MAGTGTFGLGWVWFVAAGQARFVGVWCGAARIGSLRQVRHGTVRRGLVRHVQDRHSRSGSDGQGVLWSGKARMGTARQAGRGEVSSGKVG